MLIDIPEQKNCSVCEFCGYEQGEYFLKTAIMGKTFYTKVNYDYHAEENRPEWYPFKKKNDEIKDLLNIINSLSRENSKLAETTEELIKQNSGKMTKKVLQKVLQNWETEHDNN